MSRPPYTAVPSRLIIPAVLAVLASLGAFGPAAAAGDLRPQVDALAQPLIDDGLAVGMMIGILQDGQQQVFAYGETRLGSGQAPDGETLYEIGSVTKVFTSVLLAGLVLAESVDLDDAVQAHLPDSVRVPIRDALPITLEHLATHMSGLPRLPSNLLPADFTNPYADYTVAQLYAFLQGHQLRRPPGQYEYSNLGMGLLGHVLARHRGTTFEQLVVEQIADPLNMQDTRVALNPDQQQRLAPPYDAARQPAANWDLPTLAGAGALRSTVNDMLLFARANLAGGDDPLHAALQMAQQKRHELPDGLAGGLGWLIARDGISLWHSGMTGGYAAWLSVVPPYAVAVVVLANTATEKVNELGELVTRVACGVPVAAPERRQAIAVDPAVLATYTGVYAMTPAFLLTVTLEGEQLYVQATGQAKIPVFAASSTEFFYKVVDARITFVVESDGTVPQLFLHQNGLDMPARRQP